MKNQSTCKNFLLPSGEEVRVFTLKNSKGNFVNLLTLGGAIQSWTYRKSNNDNIDIVLGLEDCSHYLKPHPSFGTVVGPYANRIANARYTFEGEEFHLTQNDGLHQLHGGLRNLATTNWTVMDFGIDFLILRTIHESGRDGYPGNLKVEVHYNYSDTDTLEIHFTATTDFPRPVNLTVHPYFNLSGEMGNSVLNHHLYINSDKITLNDHEGIPTGAYLKTNDDYLYFSKMSAIEEVLRRSNLVELDHNFVLNNDGNSDLPSASLICPIGGLRLDVLTSEPGLQVYTGNGLDGEFNHKNGQAIMRYSGICLEPQHFPDSPNHRHFPNTILKPGEVFKSFMAYRLSDLSL